MSLEKLKIQEAMQLQNLKQYTGNIYMDGSHLEEEKETKGPKINYKSSLLAPLNNDSVNFRFRTIHERSVRKGAFSCLLVYRA